MKKPEVEVIKLSDYDVLATISCEGNSYCEGNCAPVQGFCTECLNDCTSLD